MQQTAHSLTHSTGTHTHLLRNEVPEHVNVDSGTEVLLVGLVEVAHTDLAEITRVAGG